MASKLCCSAQDIIDAELGDIPKSRHLALGQAKTLAHGDEQLDSHGRSLNEIFLAALRTDSPIAEQANGSDTPYAALGHSQLRKISRHFSRESAALKLAAAKQRIQRTSQNTLNVKNETDILIDTTPSLGGYDNDASLLDDRSLSAIALRLPSNDSAGPSLDVTRARHAAAAENDDDVFSPREIPSPGAPRLPSIASGSISIKWPMPGTWRHRHASQSSDIASAVQDLLQKAPSINNPRDGPVAEQPPQEDVYNGQQHVPLAAPAQSSSLCCKEDTQETIDTFDSAAPLVSRPSKVNGSQESLHLYTMRISQHLRSLSNLSSSSGLLQSDNGTFTNSTVPENPLGFQSMDSRIADRQPTSFESLSLENRQIWNSIPLSASLCERQDVIAAFGDVSKVIHSRGASEDEGSTKHYDGPNDTLLSPHSQLDSSRSRQRSIDEDYEEAAALWSRALGEYADEAEERKRLHRSNSKWDFTVPAVSRNSSRRHSMIPLRRRNLSGADKGKSRAASAFELKPSTSQPGLGRRDAESYGATTAMDSSDDSQDEPPRPCAPPPLQAKMPLITVTDTETLDAPFAKSSTRQRSGSSLAAWSKYPSHSRHLRSFSAGILDNVFARDFADFGSTADDSSDHALETNRSSKKQKSRLSRSALKKRFLSDIPKLFKSHASASHRTLRGHRTSTSAAKGAVEFPELELIPGSEASRLPRVTPFRKNSQIFHTGSPKTRRRSTVADPLATPVRSGLPRPRAVPRVGSSSYGSASEHVNAGNAAVASHSDGTCEAGQDWKHLYREVITPMHNINHNSLDVKRLEDKSDDSTALLIGTVTARTVSPGTKSLPPTFALTSEKDADDEPQTGSRKVRRSMSAQPMRRSTHDLLTRLDEEEEAEMARALRLAEEVWSS